MMTGAVYIRVSTEEQTEFSPEAQKRAILEYAKKNNIIIDQSHIYADEGISGRKAEKRPAFMEMIATAKKKPRPFDVILVHRFDRFARNREDSVVYKSLLRKECGIKVVSITEQLEDDKFSIILESMLEAMAEYYSLNLADEVKKGMFEKARRGEHIGKAPYGYIVKDGKLIPDEYESSIVRSMFDMYVNKCYSITKISFELNRLDIKTKYGGKWRPVTIGYILDNPVYIGKVRYNYMSSNKYTPNPKEEWIIADSDHTPLVTNEIYEKALNIRTTRTPFTIEKTKSLRSFTQHIVFCSYCGHKLFIHSDKPRGHRGSYSAYRCSYGNMGHCKDFSCYSVKKFENALLNKISEDIQNPQFISVERKISNTDTAEIEAIENLLKKNAEKFILIKKAYLSGADTLEEYKENKIILNEEKTHLENKLNNITKEFTTNINFSEKLKSFYDVLISDKYTIDEKHRATTQFIHKIILNLSTKEFQIIYTI